MAKITLATLLSADCCQIHSNFLKPYGPGVGASYEMEKDPIRIARFNAADCNRDVCIAWGTKAGIHFGREWAVAYFGEIDRLLP